MPLSQEGAWGLTAAVTLSGVAVPLGVMRLAGAAEVVGLALTPIRGFFCQFISFFLLLLWGFCRAEGISHGGFGVKVPSCSVVFLAGVWSCSLLRLLEKGVSEFLK